MIVKYEKIFINLRNGFDLYKISMIFYFFNNFIPVFNIFTSPFNKKKIILQYNLMKV